MQMFTPIAVIEIEASPAGVYGTTLMRVIRSPAMASQLARIAGQLIAGRYLYPIKMEKKIMFKGRPMHCGRMAMKLGFR